MAQDILKRAGVIKAMRALRDFTERAHTEGGVPRDQKVWVFGGKHHGALMSAEGAGLVTGDLRVFQRTEGTLTSKGQTHLKRVFAMNATGYDALRIIDHEERRRERARG